MLLFLLCSSDLGCRYARLDLSEKLLRRGGKKKSCFRRNLPNERDFKVTHLAPCSVVVYFFCFNLVALFCFPYGRTDTMIEYNDHLSAGAWWVKKIAGDFNERKTHGLCIFFQPSVFSKSSKKAIDSTDNFFL